MFGFSYMFQFILFGWFQFIFNKHIDKIVSYKICNIITQDEILTKVKDKCDLYDSLSSRSLQLQPKGFRNKGLDIRKCRLLVTKVDTRETTSLVIVMRHLYYCTIIIYI